MASGEFTYEDAQRWLATHPNRGVPTGRFKRRARQLGPSALSAMVEVLAHGTADEVGGAFSVLYANGARVEREGDTPGTCWYRVAFVDGTTRSIHPDNLSAEDFDDQTNICAEVGAPAEGPEALKKSWTSEAVLAVLVTGMVVLAANTTGLLHIVCLVIAVGAALLLLWSLMILIVIERLVALRRRMQRRGDGDEPG